MTTTTKTEWPQGTITAFEMDGRRFELETVLGFDSCARCALKTVKRCPVVCELRDAIWVEVKGDENE